MRYERPPSEVQRRIIEEPELSLPLKVIAGAGTGKTFVLAHRFVWLVVHRGIAPERLLALTFTRNAAAEMRGRIRRLLRLNGYAQSPTLWVHTFHGFADRVVRENAYAAGLNPDPRVLSEVQEDLYLGQLLEAVFSGELAHVTPLAPSVLANLGVEKPGDLRQILSEMLRQAKGAGLRHEEFLEEALRLCHRFWSALPRPQTTRELAPDDLPEAVRSGLFAALDPEELPQSPGSEWEAKATLEVRKLYFQAERKGGRPVVPRDDTQALFDRARAAEEGLVRAAAALYEQYVQRLHAEGAIDYDGQIIQALNLLRDPGLRLSRHYRSAFDYLLVDEFQDSSRSQLELLRLLSRPQQVTVVGPRGTREEDTFERLLVVGDCKQSIYGWRNARPQNMDELLPFDPDDTIKSREIVRPLTQSYRLTPEITVIANRLGEQAGPEDPALEPGNQSRGLIVYPPLFQTPSGSLRQSRREEAEYIAEQILAFQRQGQVTDLQQVAVLLRRRNAFRPLKVAFERHGLRYQAQGGVGFFEHPLARDLLAWLRALQDPQQDRYLVRLLSSPPYGLSDRELFLLLTSPDSRGRRRRAEAPAIDLIQQCLSTPRDSELSSEAWDRIQAFQDQYAALADLARQAPARQVVEALWRHRIEHAALTSSEEAAVPVVRATFEGLIEEITEERPPHLDDLTHILDLYLGDDQRQLPVVDQPAQGAVQVLTLHAAKGLEWPVVFLPAWTPHGFSRTAYDDHWGFRGLKSTSLAPKDLILKMLDKGTGSRDDEEQRLAYVGVTRAERILAVTRAVGGSEREPEYPGSAFFADVVEQPPAVAVSETAGHGRVRPAAPVVLRRSQTRPPETLRASFTQLRQLENCPLSWVLSRQTEGWPEAGSGQPQAVEAPLVGSRFHEFAAAVNRGQIPPQGPQPRQLAAKLAADLPEAEARRLLALSEVFLDSEWVCPEADAEVERPLLLVQREKDCLVEITGVADLFLPGSARLVDYKTEAAMSPAHRAEHALQMHIYREALRAEGVSDPVTVIIAHVQRDAIQTLTFTEDELQTQSQRLKALLHTMVATAGGEEVEVRAGPHCQYCGFAACCSERARVFGEAPEGA